MNTYELDVESSEESIPSRDLFVGKKADYYNKKWAKAEEKSGTSFNLAAFLFSFFWLGYRKAYLPIVFGAIGFLVIDIIVYFTGYEQPVTWVTPLDSAINMGVTILFALSGNAIYKWHVDRKIQNIDALVADEEERRLTYATKGGTSWWGVVVALLIMLVVYVIPASFIPLNYNSIEVVQTAGIEYSDGVETQTLTLKELFDGTFKDGEWAYTDEEALGKDYVKYTGYYGSSEFVVTFDTVEDEDYVMVLALFMDGEDTATYLEVEPLDFILNLYLVDN